MTTGQSEQVDWDSAVRSERRREALWAVPVVGSLAGFLLLVGPGPGHSRGLVLLLPTVYAAAFLLIGGIRLVLMARTGRTDKYRSRYALRRHLDPGPGLRTAVDRRARRTPGRWRLWLLPPALVPLLMLAPWDEFWAPVPGALLLGGSVVFAMIVRLREAGAARRWLADPPGPPRDA